MKFKYSFLIDNLPATCLISIHKDNLTIDTSYQSSNGEYYPGTVLSLDFLDINDISKSNTRFETTYVYNSIPIYKCNNNYYIPGLAITYILRNELNNALKEYFKVHSNHKWKILEVDKFVTGLSPNFRNEFYYIYNIYQIGNESYILYNGHKTKLSSKNILKFKNRYVYKYLPTDNIFNSYVNKYIQDINSCKSVDAYNIGDLHITDTDEYIYIGYFYYKKTIAAIINKNDIFLDEELLLTANHRFINNKVLKYYFNKYLLSI